MHPRRRWALAVVCVVPLLWWSVDTLQAARRPVSAVLQAVSWRPSLRLDQHGLSATSRWCLHDGASQALTARCVTSRLDAHWA